jgi:Raf kinase inhibitor-like YbhB/YbcL family protein
MQLNSTAFREGERIPRCYTCDGENISPPLSWTTPPTKTKSFAVLCEDPDAPGKMWHHWAIFDIPAAQRTLPEDIPRGDLPEGLRQARNDFHRTGYDGPCPPHGHGRHRYRFRLLALSHEHLSLSADCTCDAVAKAARSCALAEAELVGIFDR